MKFEKFWQKDFNGVYAASPIPNRGMACPFFATEDHGGAILLEDDASKERIVWEAPGGSMNTVSVPGKDGEFLSIQQFFPIFQSKEAIIVWGYPDGDTWKIETKLHVPFVHRIEILESDEANYLIVSQLAADKDSIPDWSKPGALYAAEIDFNNRTVGEPKLIMGEMFQNHGLLRTYLEGKPCVLSASSRGIWVHYPPCNGKKEWENVQILKEQSSDICLQDLDGDGILEMGVISDFHGDVFSVYKLERYTCKKVYTMKDPHAFGHAIWGDTFNGVPTMFVGYRAGDMGLYAIRWNEDKKTYAEFTVDTGTGPTNCSVLHREGEDWLLAANRETNHCAIYREIK